MKISVEYDGVIYSGETKDTSINVPWTAGLRVFFKILRKHGYVFEKIKPMVEACAKVNDTFGWEGILALGPTGTDIQKGESYV